MVTKNAARKVRPMMGSSLPGSRMIASGIQARMGIGLSSSRIGNVKPKKIRRHPINMPIAIPNTVAERKALATRTMLAQM